MCEVEDCKKKASFNYIGEKARFCFNHKLENMIDVINKKCEFNSCPTQPKFNYKGEKGGRFCSKHKMINMINVVNKTCEFTNCIVRPCFNFYGEKIGRFCSKHKMENMVDITKKTCEYQGCETIPIYNYKDIKIGKFCVKHKLEQMVDIRHKVCQYTDCLIRANYATDIGQKAQFCNTHKLENMIDVVNIKKCEFFGCKIQPIFNFKDKKGGRFCSEHKLEGMIDVKRKTCKFENCTNQPYFNYKGFNSGKFCSIHKLDKMINTSHKICEYENCNVRSNYNYIGEKVGRFCNCHKLEGMVDILNKTCIYQGCSTRAYYGFCGQTVTHCTKHKSYKMFKNPKIKCYIEDCSNLATYGKTEPKHCEFHSVCDEICLLENPCKLCGENEILNKEGFCVNKCSLTNIFYEQKNQLKKKETLMIQFLNENLKCEEYEYKVIDDKTIDTQCNSYRPDRIYDCGTHFVIVECDEYQHKYKQICTQFKSLKHQEESRMFAIQQASGINCFFIRWNPDSFKINDSICKKYSMNNRLSTLKNLIKYCCKLEVLSIGPPKYINLFFDNYDESNVLFIEIYESSIIL